MSEAALRKVDHFHRFTLSRRGIVWLRVSYLPGWTPGRAYLLKRLWKAPP